MLCVDLSSHNAAPDFRSLKAHGVDGVWIKATEGTNYVNPYYAAWHKAAAGAGLRVGAYHFARPDAGKSPSEQADWFVKHAAKPGRRDLRPVLDYEVRKTGGGDEQWVRAFNGYVKATLGVGPLFYSYLALIGELKFSRPVGYGLWLADYTTVAPKPPAPWEKIAAWQYTDKGELGTYGPVDLSHTYGLAVLAHPILGAV